MLGCCFGPKFLMDYKSAVGALESGSMSSDEAKGVGVAIELERLHVDLLLSEHPHPDLMNAWTHSSLRCIEHLRQVAAHGGASASHAERLLETLAVKASR